MLKLSWQLALCSLAALYVIGEILFSLVGKSVLLWTHPTIPQVVTISLTKNGI